MVQVTCDECSIPRQRIYSFYDSSIVYFRYLARPNIITDLFLNFTTGSLD